MPGAVDDAKQVLADDEAVLYGIFGMIGCSGYFPPREFLNEFLKWGHDPCDQDRRMSTWLPFTLSPDEFEDVKAWSVAGHPGTTEDRLNSESWNDWVQEMLDRLYEQRGH